MNMMWIVVEELLIDWQSVGNVSRETFKASIYFQKFITDAHGIGLEKVEIT